MARSLQKAKATKAQAKKPTLKTTAFGVYYKGDTDNGMGMTLSVASGVDQSIVEAVYRDAKEFAADMIEATAEVRADGTSDEENIAGLISAIEEEVAKYNMALHGTPTQPHPEDCNFKYYRVTRPVMNHMIIIAGLVAAATYMGAMKDDNQNGWNVIEQLELA
jgi:hypothetical protein